MKKVISILLTFAMMLSLSVLVFAATPSITLDKEYKINLSGGKEVNYTFTVPQDGVYNVKIEALNKSSEVAYVADLIVYKNDIELANALADINLELWEPYYSLDDNFAAKKGDKLSVKLSALAVYGENHPTTEVTFIFSRIKNIREIEMGKSYETYRTGEAFLFKAKKDTICNIKGNEPGHMSVISSDGEYLYSIYAEDLLLDFSFKVKAGEIYYLDIAPNTYPEGDNIPDFVPFTITLSDGSNIKPESIELEDICIAKGDYSFYSIRVLPLGSNANCDDLELELGNDELVFIEYDGNSTLYVGGYKIGKTTLTVTEPVSGISTTVNVRVVSPLRMYLINLFERIAAFFSFIFS